MHEFSIARALIARVEAEAGTRAAVSVRRLQVRIGELAGVEPELLASAYEVLRKDTLCGEAELEVEAVPACWSCPRCEGRIARGEALRCPACDEPARLASGDEIVLERIEMEVS